MLATNSLFNLSLVSTEGSSRNSGISAAGESPSPHAAFPGRRSRRRARSLARGRAAASEPHGSGPRRSALSADATQSQARPGHKSPPREQLPTKCGQPEARTNPSPHTTAPRESCLLRPRPNKARRHWRAAGGSAAAIGGAPRAGSISRGAERERGWRNAV